MEESGELPHDKVSSKSLRKRAKSKSMEDETGSDLGARSHKQRKVHKISDASPHEEAKGGKSKQKHKQKSADSCGSGKSPAGHDFGRHHLSPSPKSHHSRRNQSSPSLKSSHSHRHRSSKSSHSHKHRSSKSSHSQGNRLSPSLHHSCRYRSQSPSRYSRHRSSPPSKSHHSHRDRYQSPHKSHHSNASRHRSRSPPHSCRHRSRSSYLSPPRNSDCTAEKPRFNANDKVILEDRPDKGTPAYDELQKHCSQVKIILHTVNDNEHLAALNYMKSPSGNSNGVQNFPNVGMAVGVFAKKKVVLIQTDPGGSCEEMVKETISCFPSAQYILAVGVCYAFDRKKHLLGDVLVSRKISDLNNFKFRADGGIEDRGQTVNVAEYLSRIFCKRCTFSSPFKVTDTRNSKVHAGTFLSHPVLMNNKSERDKFHAAVPTAIGGEMEGGVLMKLAQLDQLKGVIIIKGVVDYGDGTKDKDWQFTTAMAAFKYTETKLRSVDIVGMEVEDGAGVEQPDESCMETDTAGAGLGGLPRRMETDNGAMKLDVLDVVEEVAPLAAVWDKLALKLHLTFDSIEIINKDNPRDSRACLTKAMAEWTKKNYDTEKFGVPSWRMLIIAVQSFNMGLAQKIAAKHNVSMP